MGMVMGNEEQEKRSSDAEQGGEEQQAAPGGAAPDVPESVIPEPEAFVKTDEEKDIRLAVTISSNALEAYVTIRTQKRTAVPREMVEEALQREHVVYGVQDAQIDDLIRPDGVRGHPVLVARGKEAERGQDSYLEFHFETDPKPKVRSTEDGKIDYRETGILQQVKQGQLLAVKHPATKGEDGVSVTGRPIQGKLGRDAPLQRGANTHFLDEEKLRLAASIPGCAKLRAAGEIEVSGEYIVEGDVDYKTGNIRFDGSVIVKGDVKSGFEVVASRDLEIKGIIEDASIHCGGKLFVRGGFVGNGKGIARVCGETHIRFLENQTVECNQDVYIAEEIIHAKVISGGTVYVKFGKGAVIGGQIIARKGIEAKVFGNIHYLRTKLQVAKDPAADELIESIGKVLDQKDTTREKLQTAINNLVKRKYENEDRKLTADEEKHLAYLYHVLGHFDEWVRMISQRQEMLLRERVNLDHQAYVKADHRAHPGVSIEIDKVLKQLDQEYEKVLFRLHDGIVAAMRPTGYEGEFRPIMDHEKVEEGKEPISLKKKKTGKRRK